LRGKFGKRGVERKPNPLRNKAEIPAEPLVKRSAGRKRRGALPTGKGKRRPLTARSKRRP